MGLLGPLIRNVVLPLAKKFASDAMPFVSHKKWLSQSTTGAPTEASAVKRNAIVEFKVTKVRTINGQEVTSRAKLTFLEPVAVDAKDTFTLLAPSGAVTSTLGPVLEVGGLVDESTGKTFYTEVWLG